MSVGLARTAADTRSGMDPAVTDSGGLARLLESVVAAGPAPRGACLTTAGEGNISVRLVDDKRCCHAVRTAYDELKGPRTC